MTTSCPDALGSPELDTLEKSGRPSTVWVRGRLLIAEGGATDWAGGSLIVLFSETSVPELRVGDGTGDERGRGFGLVKAEALETWDPLVRADEASTPTFRVIGGESVEEAGVGNTRFAT